MKLQLRRVLREGEKFPRGYGLAFWDMPMSLAVCYPLPLNLLVGRLHKWLIAISIPAPDVQAEILEKRLDLEYNKGLEEGDRRYRASLQNIRDEEFRKGVTFGFERCLNESRNQITEIIAAEIKKAMDKEVIAGRWWTEAPTVETIATPGDAQ